MNAEARRLDLNNPPTSVCGITPFVQSRSLSFLVSGDFVDRINAHTKDIHQLIVLLHFNYESW